MHITFLQTWSVEWKKCFVGKQVHHKSNLYLIISWQYFFFSRQCSVGAALLWKCCFVLFLTVTSLHIQNVKSSDVRYSSSISHPGRWKWVVWPLNFIYPRHSDIVIKWIYPCSFRKMHFFKYIHRPTLWGIWVQNCRSKLVLDMDDIQITSVNKHIKHTLLLRVLEHIWFCLNKFKSVLV